MAISKGKICIWGHRVHTFLLVYHILEYFLFITHLSTPLTEPGFQFLSELWPVVWTVCLHQEVKMNLFLIHSTS